MHCPKCGHSDTKVIDTRLGKNNLSVRRRRQCQRAGCACRFTTVEEILREDLYVLKRDGRRVPFDRDKVVAGIRKATEKRGIEAEQIEMLLADLYAELERKYDTEVSSRAIGEMIMKRLKEVDQIAYVRFASVYKDFRDIDELAVEIDALKKPER
jgi:transcriptional repressor NrdR